MTRNVHAGEEPILVASDIVRRFGSVVALNNVSVEAYAGEFLTLLGASGSGKTTLLRIIGGFDMPTSITSLRIANKDVLNVPANHRSVATVFQHYGLFPHMTVGENVGYGLRVRRMNKRERHERVTKALKMVRLGHTYDRRIHQLSGGERQRIALARAIVTEPAILLLDEPLGALDEKLREDMQIELHNLQRELGTTFIHVTHNQEEAVTMSDRVILMNEGQVEQMGTPQALFEQPETRIVADFMGIDNILDGCFRGGDGCIGEIVIDNLSLRGTVAPDSTINPEQPAFIAVRSEQLKFFSDDSDIDPSMNLIPCEVKDIIYKGNYYDMIVKTSVGEITGCVWSSAGLDTEFAYVGWAPEDCFIGPASR